jgi:hypothetical protein
LRIKARGKWIKPTTAVTALVIDPADRVTLYAATTGSVYRSTDSGESGIRSTRASPTQP